MGLFQRLFGIDKKVDRECKENKEDKAAKERIRLIQYGEELKQGHENMLKAIYWYVVSEDGENANLASKMISEYMESLDCSQMIKLNDSFREATSLEWFIEWKDVELNELKNRIKQEYFPWVVRLGTFHPNGFYRERCIHELENDIDSFGLLILRYNDWVTPVRKTAVNACMGMIDSVSADTFCFLPYLEKVHQSKRREDEDITQLEEIFADRMYSLCVSSGLNVLYGNDVIKRKIAYRILLERGRLTKNEVKDILKEERNGQCLRSIAAAYINDDDISLEEIDELIRSKSVFIQRKAIDKKYEILGDYWNGLEEKLLSTSRGIRDTVSFILRKHTAIDIKKYYIDHLEKSDDKTSAICILGIGESGTKEDVDYLMRFLDEKSARITKSVLHAMGMLGADNCEEVYWKYLHDDRLDVMCRAYREIKDHNISIGAEKIYDLFTHTECITRKKKLLSILIKEPSWDRLPYLLMLYRCKDEYIKEAVKKGLNGRSVYVSVSKQKAERIEQIMQDPKYGIPKEIKDRISFDLKHLIK